jgi:hypothetical protein
MFYDMFYDLRGGCHWPQKFPGRIWIWPDPYGKQLASWNRIRKKYLRIHHTVPQHTSTVPTNCLKTFRYGALPVHLELGTGTTARVLFKSIICTYRFR